MRRSMAWAGLIGLVFLFFALVAYLTGARLYFLLNLVLGVLATLALGIGLMALVFISNRRGYDDPPREDH